MSKDADLRDMRHLPEFGSIEFNHYRPGRQSLIGADHTAGNLSDRWSGLGDYYGEIGRLTEFSGLTLNRYRPRQYDK